MIFARKVWKLLVAVKDGLVLLLMVLFFMGLYAALSARPNVATVREGALLLKLDGALVEEPQAIDPLRQLISGQAPVREYRARDVVRAVRAAATDDKIKAVVLDLGTFTGGGFVHMQELGAALDAVRAAKKPVLTYAAIYADDAVQLAAHSSEAWVHPMGGAIVMGPGGNRLYYGRLLEKLKVTPHVFRVGTFKSAVEPFLRNDQSPESRAAAQAVYGAIWRDWLADVTKARPRAKWAVVTADPAGWMTAHGGDAAKAAIDAGLVDRIGSEIAFGDRVAQIVGKDPVNPAPGHFAHTPLRTWLAANPLSGKGKGIGVVTIAGEIVDGEAGPGTAGGERIGKVLDDALDDGLAALVVRVDSPGGSVMASERIREAIGRYKAKGIPVVVSMANLAASGGYWVSTPASRIFAAPGTITGSIGIFAIVPSFERALGDLGVTADGVKTTPLSGQPDVVGGLSPEVSAMLQANVENGYARFIGLVGQSRGKTPQQVDAIGQGRVWDGATAKANGLVDEFGGLDAALAYAARQAKLADGNWHPVFLGEKTDRLAAVLESLRGDGDSAPPAEGAADWAAYAADRQLALVEAALADAARMLGARGAQAYCLECPVAHVAAPDRSREMGVLARIAAMAKF